MASDPPLPPPPAERRPPAGVPRWLWPPPGARVVRLTLVERALEGDAETSFVVEDGPLPEALHLRALQWLLEDHDCLPRPPGGPTDGRASLEIARTELPGGRVGHAYALVGGPLGAPLAGAARGLLRRFTVFALRQGGGSGPSPFRPI